MVEQKLVIQTELYSVEILISPQGLKRIRLLEKQTENLVPLPLASELPWLPDLVRFLKDRLSTHPFARDFEVEKIPLDWSQLSDFQSSTLKALAKTQKGDVLTYGELAQRIGKPKAARAVGTAMRKNPFPVLIPCHRVVRTSGLGNYTGPEGKSLKAFLLGTELN